MYERRTHSHHHGSAGDGKNNGGFDHFGPWFSAPLTQAAALEYEVHYVVLRAGRTETMKRAVGRSKLNKKTNAELVEIMWKYFCRLGDYERFVIDTTNRSIDETVSLIKERIIRRICKSWKSLRRFSTALAS